MDGSSLQEFDPPLKVRVARTLDDLQKISVVRALVYMNEQDCPYDEEFDGNDFAGATHLILEVGSEPVGCLRIRWFSGFAKLERVCVRKHHRSTRAAVTMIKFAFEQMRRKGYTRCLAHIQAQLEDYWARHGLIRRENRKEFVFSDRAYVEVEADLSPHPMAVTIDSEPLVVDRPEGDWDRPGPLDMSTSRGVSPAQFEREQQRGIQKKLSCNDVETA